MKPCNCLHCPLGTKLIPGLWHLQGLSSGLEGSLAALVVAKQSAQSQVHASAAQVEQACQSLRMAAVSQHGADLAVADGILKTTSEAGQKLSGEAYRIHRISICTMGKCVMIHARARTI